MKSKIIIAAVAVAALLLLISTCHQCRQKVKDIKRSQSVTANTMNGEAIIVERYIHDTVPHVVVKEVPALSAADKTIAVGKTYIDSVSRALDIAVSKISELTKVNATLTARVKLLSSVEQNADHTAIPVKRIRDKYLEATYYPHNDSLLLNYNVALQTARYAKKNWLLGREHSYIDIWSDDPRVKINSVKRFREDVTPRVKRFGIGPFVGAAFDGRFKPVYGVGLQYNLIRF